MVAAGMNSLQSRVFADRDALDHGLSADVVAILARAINERGRATLVVSGGSTPINFFRLLSNQSLPWNRVSVLLADERWVSPDDQASNERLVRNNLLINAAREANFIPLKTANENPEEAEQELEKRLALLGTFDLVILGMGADGHTASLFPGAAALERALDVHSDKQCIGVIPLQAPHRRISLTLSRLLNSRDIFLHITGNEKRAVLREAIDSNDSSRLPIAAFANQQQTPLTLYFSP